MLTHLSFTLNSSHLPRLTVMRHKEIAAGAGKSQYDNQYDSLLNTMRSWEH